MKTITTLFGCALLLLAACDVKDPIYNTPHPGQGVVAGITEWTERTEGVAVPAEYRVEASGTAATAANTTTTATAAAFTLPGLFAPGAVEVLAYSLPAGVGVDGGIATVGTGADGTLLVPDAGVLFSGVATAAVAGDDTARVVVVMQQRMRLVRFTLTVTKGNAERITAIEAQLEGMAASADLRTGAVTGGAAAVRIPFVRQGNKLTAEVWTVGTAAGAQQQIVTTLTFTDGNHTTTTADVSDLFRGFNDDRLTPLTVTGSLYAPIGAEPDGSIIDWKPGNGDGEDVDAKI